MTIRIGETAAKLAACFGVDCAMPFNIPVWVADVNCEKEPFADEVVSLHSASGNGEDSPDYALLNSGKRVLAFEIFLRGVGYYSPSTMNFQDNFGNIQQPGQNRRGS